MSTPVQSLESFFGGTRTLVAGGTGLIGRFLVDRLLQYGAHVRIASLDNPLRANPAADFRQADLLNFRNCFDVCDGIDLVFNLVGVKGSPAMAATRPASYLVPTVTLEMNLMEAARQQKADRYLFTSSLAVYPPAEVFREDEVWNGFPSKNDWFPGWAKRVGELQAEAYRIEYGWDGIVIVRPANVYGPYDNFDLDNAMVVPSLIRRVVSGEDPLRVWGDGSTRRDFVYAQDVADGMLLAMKSLPSKPVNLGSGVGTSIKELADTIGAAVGTQPTIQWDLTKPSGDPSRILDISRARALGYEPTTSLFDGISRTVEWYRSSSQSPTPRYDVFLPGRSSQLLS